MSRLTMEQIKWNLSKVPGWRLAEDQITLTRTVTCADFLSAVRLVNQVSEYVDSEQHYPEIRIAGGTVTFTLYTQQARGLTGKDFALAQVINKLI